MRAVAAGLAALAAGAALAAPAAVAGEPAPLTVHAQAGRESAAVAALGRTALRVQRRDGRRLQVLADPRRRAALRRLPGVAGVHPSVTAFPDAVSSEGLARTGALALGTRADGGRGLVIAVLDLGFGLRLPQLQATRELPPPERLEVMSFDPSAGLEGRNAYGGRTNHGELVAQTVYDYAPEASYVFVNYRSESDFVAAADWLAARRPDIVVHSNSFIEGPFDGTGAPARAVDRVAAAGVLWFNSAGNYAQRHWSGGFADADGDDVHDWPDGWTFARPGRDPISFALSWPARASGAPTDLDLVLEREEAGQWRAVAASADRQPAGMPPAERIIGFASESDGLYRLRIRHVSGPRPDAGLTLFSREIPLGPAGGTPASSTPTPGDAAGSITVGAVSWRGDRYKGYSSQGPTDDGRPKPDLSAPTDTRIVDRYGRGKRVGGTSNAAPNAAGAAAVLLAARRRAGTGLSRDALAAELSRIATDLGPSGPDPAFGAGRVRVEISPPRAFRLEPEPLASVRGRVPVGFRLRDASPIAQAELLLDGVRVRFVRGRTAIRARIDTRRLPDGFHLLRAEARDLPGNLGAGEWAIRVDNTPPLLRVGRVEVIGAPRAAPRRPRPRRASTPERPRRVRVEIGAQDPGSTGSLALSLRVARPGSPALARRVTLRPTASRLVAVGRLAPGRYTMGLELRDRAGNPTRATRRLLVR